MTHDSPQHLGQPTRYPTQYAPHILEPIARSLGRAQRPGSHPWPYHGIDEWTAYELSWLDLDGRPQVGMARFEVPCHSPAIVESKSLKLYLFSLNNERFQNRDAFTRCVTGDLSAAFGAAIRWQWSSPDLERVEGLAARAINIDTAAFESLSLQQAREALVSRGAPSQEHLVTDIFRSLCPVTAQPDWATLGVIYQGPAIDRGALLSYLCSYREHQDFHERCVESIFMDVMGACQPQGLTVYARYTRRGGLDINPLRATDPAWPACPRAWRQ